MQANPIDDGVNGVGMTLSAWSRWCEIDCNRPQTTPRAVRVASNYAYAVMARRRPTETLSDWGDEQCEEFADLAVRFYNSITEQTFDDRTVDDITMEIGEVVDLIENLREANEPKDLILDYIADALDAIRLDEIRPTCTDYGLSVQ
jgi:hypothetical protein